MTMKLAALVYAGSLSPHALKPIAGGGSAYARCLDFVSRLPGIERVAVAEGRVSLPEGPYPKLRREAWTLELLFEEMAKVGEGADAVLLAWADEPFLDPALAAKMLEDFRRYRAEYGFADGYPVGLSAEIVSPRILGALAKLAAPALGSAPAEIERGSLFATVQKDINAFDIETDISPVDLRDLRLELACDTKRNALLVERLAEAGVSDAATALKVIPERMELLRTLPAFVQVQVASGCPQSCRLCAYPAFGGGPTGGDILSLRRDMELDKFASVLDQVVDLCEDAVIDISLWGEPAMHADIGGIIEEVLDRPGLSLIVETSGLGWDPKVVDRIASVNAEHSGPLGARAEGSGRIDWIVSLDAWSPELYAQMRGEGYEEAVAFAERLIELFPGHLHVQMVRSRDNEAELEAFWRGWKKKTDKVIVQKYSRQAGLLPDRKVSDLSPLLRRPCWHLKRDLSVLVDGTVPLCRDFSHGDLLLGNAFEAKGGRPAGLAAAWEAGAALHAAHIAASRTQAPGIFPPPCEACDEYYTYNA
jgi:spiro-SPASM protein